MLFSGMIGKAAGALVTGLAGAVVYDGVKKVVRGGVAHQAAVTVTALGLRGARAAETGAEKARLAAADIASEARERIGEQAPVPGAGDAHGHEH